MSLISQRVKEFGGRRAVAEKVGCSVEFIRLLEGRKKTPGLALAIELEKALSIPVTYWKQRAAQRGGKSKSAA